MSRHPKRSIRRGHVRQYRRGWAVVISHGSDPQTGKRQRTWHYGFDSKQAAEEALTRLLSSKDRGEWVDPSRLTVAEFFTRWLDVRRDAIRPSTHASYSQLVNVYVLPTLGRVRLQKLRPDHLATLYAQLRASGRKRGGGLSKRSVRYIHTVVGRALRDAERWALVPRNVARLVEPPGTGTAERPCWTLAQAMQFLKATRGDRDAHLWRLAIASGARCGELLAATWDDLDEAGLRIERALVSVGPDVVVSAPKTARGVRRIPLDDDTIASLKEHRTRQLEERLKAGEAWEARPHGLDLIFRDALGRALDRRGVLRAFQAASRRAGVSVVPFHSLRHFAAVMHARTGTSPTIAAEILGHDVRMLQSVYQLHAQPDLAADAVRRVAAALRPS